MTQLRLTGTYAFLVAFHATLYKYMCFGPGCRSIQSAADGCEKDWWKNMLYVNNFGNGNGENFATVSLLSKYNTERF